MLFQQFPEISSLKLCKSFSFLGQLVYTHHACCHYNSKIYSFLSRDTLILLCNLFSLDYPSTTRSQRGRKELLVVSLFTTVSSEPVELLFLYAAYIRPVDVEFIFLAVSMDSFDTKKPLKSSSFYISVSPEFSSVFKHFCFS